MVDPRCPGGTAQELPAAVFRTWYIQGSAGEFWRRRLDARDPGRIPPLLGGPYPPAVRSVTGSAAVYPRVAGCPSCPGARCGREGRSRSCCGRWSVSIGWRAAPFVPFYCPVPPYAVVVWALGLDRLAVFSVRPVVLAPVFTGTASCCPLRSFQVYVRHVMSALRSYCTAL